MVAALKQKSAAATSLVNIRWNPLISSPFLECRDASRRTPYCSAGALPIGLAEGPPSVFAVQRSPLPRASFASIASADGGLRGTVREAAVVEPLPFSNAT